MYVDANSSGGKSFQNRLLIRPILELQATAWKTSVQNVLKHLTTAEHYNSLTPESNPNPTRVPDLIPIIHARCSSFPLLMFLLIFAVIHYPFNIWICYIVNFKSLWTKIMKHNYHADVLSAVLMATIWWHFCVLWEDNCQVSSLWYSITFCVLWEDNCQVSSLWHSITFCVLWDDDCQVSSLWYSITLEITLWQRLISVY